jgi:hypothetical protein
MAATDDKAAAMDVKDGAALTPARGVYILTDTAPATGHGVFPMHLAATPGSPFMEIRAPYHWQKLGREP